MTDTLTDIASVSLARPLEEIADELGRSFGEFGFAVVRDTEGRAVMAAAATQPGQAVEIAFHDSAVPAVIGGTGGAGAAAALPRPRRKRGSDGGTLPACRPTTTPAPTATATMPHLVRSGAADSGTGWSCERRIRVGRAA